MRRSLPSDNLQESRLPTFGGLLPRGRRVVRLRIPELLEELEWTPYRLAKELGFVSGPL